MQHEQGSGGIGVSEGHRWDSRDVGAMEGRKEGVSQLTYAFTLHVKLLDEIKERFLFII